MSYTWWREFVRSERAVQLVQQDPRSAGGRCRWNSWYGSWAGCMVDNLQEQTKKLVIIIIVIQYDPEKGKLFIVWPKPYCELEDESCWNNSPFLWVILYNSSLSKNSFSNLEPSYTLTLSYAHTLLVDPSLDAGCWWMWPSCYRLYIAVCWQWIWSSHRCCQGTIWWWRGSRLRTG